MHFVTNPGGAVSGELPQWIIALDFLDEVRAIGR